MIDVNDYWQKKMKQSIIPHIFLCSMRYYATSEGEINKFKRYVYDVDKAFFESDEKPFKEAAKHIKSE